MDQVSSSVFAIASSGGPAPESLIAVAVAGLAMLGLVAGIRSRHGRRPLGAPDQRPYDASDVPELEAVLAAAVAGETDARTPLTSERPAWVRRLDELADGSDEESAGPG